MHVRRGLRKLEPTVTDPSATAQHEEGCICFPADENLCFNSEESRGCGTEPSPVVPRRALPRARHAQQQRPAVQRRTHGQCRKQHLCAAQHRASLRLQRDRGATWASWLSHTVAWRPRSTDGVDSECPGRTHHLEYGDRTNQQRLDRRLRFTANAADSGYLELLRAVVVERLPSVPSSS